MVREITNDCSDCGAVVAISWSNEQNHLYAATEDSYIFIWEGAKRLSSSAAKFVNLTSL